MAAREKRILRLADRTVFVVVEQKQFDRKTVVPDGLQFLKVHHQAAVPFEADHRPFAAHGGRRPQRSREAEPHRRAAGVAEHPLSPLYGAGLEQREARRRIRAADHGVGRQLFAERLHQRIRIQSRGGAVFRKHDRVALFAFAVPGEPAAPVRQFTRRERRQQPVDELPRIAVDRQRRLHCGLGQLGRVDIDHDQLLRALREILMVVADLPDVVPGAEAEHPVGILQRDVPGPGADRADPPDRIRRAGRQQIEAVEAAEHRNLQAFDQLFESGEIAGKPDSLSGHQHRRGGRKQGFDDSFDRLRRDLRL